MVSYSFDSYDTLPKEKQYELRVAHVRLGFEAIRAKINDQVALVMVAHHEFPQPICQSYPRGKEESLDHSNGNNRRTPPDEALFRLQALCALADQLDAMTDPDRIRNNGLQLIQTESQILKNIQSGHYWPESVEPHLSNLIHQALITLHQTFHRQIL